MISTKSSLKNESNPLEQRLDLIFEEIKYQRELINNVVKQNLILIEKINNIEQYICNLYDNTSNNECDKIYPKEKDIKEPQGQNNSFSKIRKQKPKSINVTEEKNVNEDSNTNESLKKEKTQKQKKPKIVVPINNKTKLMNESLDGKSNSRHKKLKIDSDSESEQEESQNSETKKNRSREGYISKETAKQNPDTWKQYIDRKVKSLPFIIGYLGEGYVYENLLKMNCFEKISWNAKTDNENNPYVTLNNGHKYFIDEDGEHFDIIAEDSNHIKYYFEIKATKQANRRARIKKKQSEFYKQLDQKANVCIVAIVKNALESPKIEYCLFDQVNGECECIGNESQFIDYILGKKKNLSENDL